MPDSEANKWLEKIQQSQKGKLKIYIGMSAGVGKSYRMLQEAHTLLRNGVNVKIGYSTVAQMTDIDFTREFKFAFDSLRIFLKKRQFFACFMPLFLALGVEAAGDALVVFFDSLKNLPHLLDGGSKALTEKVRSSCWHIQLAAADADAVLAAIALLGHQGRQHVEAIEGCAVGVLLIGQGLFQPDCG